MNTPKHHGVQVLYLGDRKAIIDKIDSSYIHIIEDNGTPHTLSYPSSFYRTHNNKQFLETSSKNMLKQLKKDTHGHICQRCGSYSTSLFPSDKKLICEDCIEEEKNKYTTCSWCHNKSLRNNSGSDCLGRFICNHCAEKRTKSKTVNFITPGIYPILYIINGLPTSCKNAKHLIESVRAKVLVISNITNTRMPQEIDILYCNTCHCYMCFFNDLELYTKRFGKVLLEKRSKNEYPEYLLQYRRKTNRRYSEDTLLSRWNYIAQEGLQPDNERRAILATIMDYDKYKKPEIISILNHFLNDRGYRCPHASILWREDLEFVHNYNVDEPFVDLTDYCK